MKGQIGALVLAMALSAPLSADDLSAPEAARGEARQPAAVRASAAGIIATFVSLDRNSDGRLSRSEAGFDRLLSAIFADSDSDGDGFLTPAEYARATGGGPVNL